MQNKTKSFSVGRFLTEWGALVAIFLSFIIFSFTAKSVFFSWANMITILRAISITTIIALGATFGFAAGVFDLSFGSIATIAAAFSITFMAWDNIPMPFAILLTLLACAAIGGINAFLVIKTHIPAFLATLGMMFILDGIELTYSGGSVINPKVAPAGKTIMMAIPDLFNRLGKAPLIIIIMLICIILVELFQHQTKHGRFLYMVGSNAEAARLSGVKVNFYRTLAFIMTAVFSGIGGILIASRAGTVAAGVGGSFLMPAIAAVNIGAAMGGRNKPNAVGTFVGAALIGVVENGLYALSFPYYAINIVKGLILLVALIMSNYANKEN
ncbi:monosaccharide ABC transporter membrane protein, CUT2 family [Acetanaerobacterium elongatum]|uniref:Monosaccharide ABC transporter membrane protein, CUT2 family n=2 Tax=Acetanaerobacterium elongatum TaxID=258515 RepID=A0A1H0H1R2_9FIRM|nr:monosaccharide ABC transporter membrane protein, CUT2 family [Acetanaerobacterium elongatum]